MLYLSQKNNNMKLGKSGMAVLAMSAMLGGMGTTAAANNNQIENRDMVKDGTEKVTPETPVNKRFTGSRVRTGGPAGRFLNQRQYRKMCAQNPHLRNSKKHRSKN